MKRILLIDDDHDMADLVKAILTSEGYGTLQAFSSQEGIETAKRERPDLILMDIMLPGMNGGEAVKILKSEPLVRDIPVIFLTALLSGSEEAEQDGVVIDGHRYRVIGKPFEIKHLLETVKLVLNPSIPRKKI